jgi:diacylglycerol O-acyltransferase-1
MKNKESADEATQAETSIEDYRAFMVRDSWLDLLIEEAKINKTQFKGFFNLFMVMLIIYVFALPVYNYFHFGYFIKPILITRMFKDLSILWIFWPMFHLWTYTAFLLQLLILKNCPRIFCHLYKYITQYGILIFAAYICIKLDLQTAQVLFITTQAIIHFFKMHSYTYVNRDFRNDWLKKNSDKDHKPISSYPNNINFGNFFYFLRAPTFIYQETYPRSGPFRYKYFILKFLKALFCITICYHIYTEHIEIVLPHVTTLSIFSLVIRIYFPVALFICSLFFLVFECVLPAYAELASFGDRQFYDDWWNAKDLEEFNRKWNKIVYQFLYRHVYIECRQHYGISRFASQFMTFVISAVFHEYCLCLLIRLVRPIMTLLMLGQIPQIMIAKRYYKSKEFGNYVFWAGIVIGNPLIFILYNREYFKYYGMDS